MLAALLALGTLFLAWLLLILFKKLKSNHITLPFKCLQWVLISLRVKAKDPAGSVKVCRVWWVPPHLAAQLCNFTSCFSSLPPLSSRLSPSPAHQGRFPTGHTAHLHLQIQVAEITAMSSLHAEDVTTPYTVSWSLSMCWVTAALKSFTGEMMTTQKCECPYVSMSQGAREALSKLSNSGWVSRSLHMETCATCCFTDI